MTKLATGFKRFYRLLTFGYKDTEGERTRHERVLFWLALALIPIMISVHSVYGLLFGMISAQAGWYNPLQAPYFVLGAIVSGFSAILVVAALLRRVYSWQQLLTNQLFRVFAIFLTFMIFLYLYFMLSEHLTAQYLPTVADGEVSNALLKGRFSTVFWLTTIIGLVIPFGYLLVQSVKKNYVNIGLTAVAAAFVNVALWLKRSLLVVPSQYQSHLSSPRQLVEYIPTHTEWVVVIGSYIVAALVFYYLLRLFPMIELPDQPADSCPPELVARSSIRAFVMTISLVAGLSFLVWGLTTLDNDYAPIKWLTGIVFILAIPLSCCLISDGSAIHAEGKEQTQAQNGQISKGDTDE
jgi:molybdopterin-containing oxidoreductase family membrane subunit